ncbi:MAG: aspartate kinase [Candidatus Bathyarchaeota archaeon]|nr:aspartate kinase [Candidatus Bathyarchaeota archaeon]
MKPEKSCKKSVVKFGGSSLADHERLSRAVAAVVNEAKRGTRIAVVVSAMGKTTDVLLNTVKNTSNGKLEKHELDDILSMGERTSVRIFSAALRTSGVDSRYFDPRDDDWPIVTDACFSNANPERQQCEDKIRRCVLPIVDEGVVPVIAGFVGKTSDGKVTTLGRGGSDTTAFLLAEAIGADEVVLATDADGIMSGDPKVVSEPKRLSEIDVNTLVGLADSGAKFIHSKALKYKPQAINVRVISSAYGDLTRDGTIITGALATELDVEQEHDSPMAEITIVGQRISDNLKLVGDLVAKAKTHATLIAMSMNTNSAILYVSAEKNLDALFNDVHQTVLENKEAKAMAVKKDIVFLKIRGVGLEETQGIIGKVSEVLRVNGINIAGILTITSSILLFVDWAAREKALELIRKSLRSN